MKACGPVTFDVEAIRIPGFASFTLTAKMHGERAGSMTLVRSSGSLFVDAVRVNRPRCGVGTKLYERAYQIACEEDVVFMSGGMRTEASEGFWQKQVRKDRAVCVDWDPAVRMYDRPGHGLVETKEVWDCGRYAMREVCPRKMDLSGRRRRRRRRR
jgi:hypothetical protein